MGRQAVCRDPVDSGFADRHLAGRGRASAGRGWCRAWVENLMQNYTHGQDGDVRSARRSHGCRRFDLGRLPARRPRHQKGRRIVVPAKRRARPDIRHTVDIDRPTSDLGDDDGCRRRSTTARGLSAVSIPRCGRGTYENVGRWPGRPAGRSLRSDRVRPSRSLDRPRRPQRHPSRTGAGQPSRAASHRRSWSTPDRRAKRALASAVSLPSGLPVHRGRPRVVVSAPPGDHCGPRTASGQAALAVQGASLFRPTSGRSEIVGIVP